MDDKIPAINMVVYLIASVTKVGKQKAFFLGGHGFTYNCETPGKKKLAKDVPTSTGYYTGNPQKPNTVVVVDEIMTTTVPNGSSVIDVLLKGLREVLELVVANNYKNLLIITPHKELEALVKAKATALGPEFKIGGEPLLVKETKELESILELVASITADKDRKILFDFAGSAEGGLGNRDAQKQLDLAQVISQWGFDKDPVTIIQTRKEYENPEVPFNKMVSATRWYFQTHDPEKFRELYEGYRVYSFGKVEPDKNYYGKLTPDVTYSKLYTKKPLDLLDKLFDYTVKRIENKDGYLAAGDLNQLVSKDVARLLDTVPALPAKNQLVSPYVKQNGRAVLIELIKPVMMSYRVREYLIAMDIIFESFLKKDANNVFNYATFYNITDLIYTKEVNGKGVTKLKIHPDFNQLRTTIKIDVTHPESVKPVPIMMSVGYDIPERNAFNSVEDPNVEVWVMTDTRNKQGLRYHTLVVTDEFIYVHTSAIANLRVLTVSELGRTTA